MKSKILENWPAKTSCLVIALVLLVVARSINYKVQYFIVPLEIRLHETAALSSEHPKQVQVRIRGSRGTVEQIAVNEISAFVDFSSYNIQGKYRAAVNVQRSGNALSINPLELRVDPEVIVVEVERRMRKTVGVTPATSDFLPAGYQMVSSRVTPETVVITGPVSKVIDVNTIETRVIDLANRTGDFTIRTTLQNPNSFIEFPQGNVVEYQGSIEEVPVLSEFTAVELLLIDLDESLQLVTPLVTGKIQVQALLKDIERVDNHDLRLIVNASKINKPGDYTVEVLPRVPQGLTVLSFEPVNIILQVERRQ